MTLLFCRDCKNKLGCGKYNKKVKNLSKNVQKKKYQFCESFLVKVIMKTKMENLILLLSEVQSAVHPILLTFIEKVEKQF